MKCNVADIGRSLIDLILPSRCVGCTQVLERALPYAVCRSCADSLRRCSPPLCPSCGTPYADPAAADHLCEKCLLTPPPFVAARSVAAYEGVLQDMIHRCKYVGDTMVGETLGKMMADYSYHACDLSDYDVVIPVPLHTKRLRERGFNQSLLLARAFAKRYNKKLDYLSLVRSVHTPPQVSFGRRDREQSVKGAFQVRKKVALEGRKVILVDDVYTTGSTVRECARTLRHAGAPSVTVLTLARALY
ncbi:MAG: ComF family protein [Deltaproteobacteria bacterium]|nr:ComF family protein [Deltaproteobacteria bacterium]